MFTAGFAWMGQCRESFQLNCACFCDEGLSVTEQMVSCGSELGHPKAGTLVLLQQRGVLRPADPSQGGGVSHNSCQLPRAHISRHC